MKGKGVVEAFLLDIPERKSRPVRRTSMSFRPSLVARLSALSDMSSDSDPASARPSGAPRTPRGAAQPQGVREVVLAGANQEPNLTGLDSTRRESTESQRRGASASRRNSRDNFAQLQELLQEMQIPETEDPVRNACRWCLRRHPFSDYFPPHVERKWYAWFHETTICSSMQRRLGKHLLLFAAFATLQVICMLARWDKNDGHNEWDVSRLVSFFVPVAVPFLILGVWRLLACKVDWLLMRPFVVQLVLLTSYAAIGFSLFFSCDALTPPDKAVQCHAILADACASKIEDEARALAQNGWAGEEWSLIAVMMYSAWTTMNPLLFLQSCILGCSTLLFLVVMNSGAFLSNLYFSYAAQCYFCCCLAVNAAIAYRAESASRTRYKTIDALILTQSRIKGILDTLMPMGVIEQLQALTPQAPLPSHHYKNVTLAQSDLVGFTKLASLRQPEEVVDIIGKLFGRYDELTDKHGLCKVETVGDAYIAAQGEWPLTDRNSPIDVILFSLEVIQATVDFAHQHCLLVGCRVGADTGECAGGIVGLEMQRYHLFGALLRRVELLESTAPEARLQVGCAGHAAAVAAGGAWDFRFEERAGVALSTSKSEVVSLEAVGGRPFIVTA